MKEVLSGNPQSAIRNFSKCDIGNESKRDKFFVHSNHCGSSY